MKYAPFLAALFGLAFFACSEDSNSASSTAEESSSSAATEIKAVDYSKGRAMNQRLGKGINFGNSWESTSYSGDIPEEPYNFGYNDRLDKGWGNPILDEDFKFVKDAGFNSVRIPVRWQHNSNPETHEVSSARMEGVIEDVKLAFDAGLAVVISFHWYNELMEASNASETNPEWYKKEMEHFVAIWTEVASRFEKEFPGSDSLLVWDILNEPLMKNETLLNEVMLAGYEAIRKVAPGKTIMFESYHAAKFADVNKLHLPEDGNIIFSGHYYEPYTFTHEGHGYGCAGDETFNSNSPKDFETYASLAKKYYPDVDGIHSIPMNMGEFGVTSPSGSCGSKAPNTKYRIAWTKDAIHSAEEHEMSWHYWGFTKVGGFEAFDRNNNVWYPGFPDAFFDAN